MFTRFRALLPHYFSKHPSHELKELYFSVGIMDFATSAVALFEPIYLWTRGYSFAQIAMFYGAVYLLYTILLPLGGRIAARFGFEHSILTSQFAFIAYYVALLPCRSSLGSSMWRHCSMLFRSRCIGRHTTQISPSSRLGNSAAKKYLASLP